MKKFSGLITVAAVSLVWILLSFTGLFNRLEFRFFDFLLRAKKAPQEASELLFVEIDNFAIDEIGKWPFKRDIHANTLLRMKELGAKQAVFDVEFLSPSEDASSSCTCSDPECIKNRENPDDIFARSVQFFGNTYLTIGTSEVEITYPEGDLDYSRSRFLHNINGDTKALIEGNQKSRYEQHFDSLAGYSKFNWENDDAKNILSEGFSPARKEFISRAKGAGFTNVIIDSDGTRRRLELLAYDRQTGKATAQLILEPLLDVLKPSDIIRNKNSILLKDANLYGTIKDIKIPLDENGRIIINWSHNQFKNSFRHDSYMFLYQLDSMENNIAGCLEVLLENCYSIIQMNPENSSALNDFMSEIEELYRTYTDILEFKGYLLSLCDGYDENSNLINGGISESLYEQYFDLRSSYFNAVLEYTNSSAAVDIQKILHEMNNSSDEGNLHMMSHSFDDIYGILHDEAEYYVSLFNEKKEVYKDSFCIIGETSSSSTDLGINPFERAFPNVGTHANVYNTIVNEDFITPVSSLWGILIAIITAFGMALLTEKRKAVLQNVFGIASVLVVFMIPVVLMHFAGIYIPSFVAIMTTLTSYIGLTILRFISTEKDKKFLQATFGAYVAPAVVAEIVKHPELASLGGKSENLTALFSDVKTFSGFTEVINNEAGEDKGAERLVEILNEYLGVLSDAIMDSNGTIDKYVGDEIVSFFGAPIPSTNNAYDACVAAIRMLQAEKKFNEENKDRLPVNPKTGEPFYLHSRIGLNTGNMVVGNMGTEKKLNYTIMGNNVNLASRLEGTNKVYGSWIMCSESTWLKANEGEYEGKLVARKFDCVRVINVKKPVGIYNILGLKDELSEQQIKAAELFNQGIELYLKGSETPEIKKDPGELKAAFELFKQADEMYPEDLSSKVFMKRCADYIKDGVPEIWDGVYTMTSK